MRIVQSLMFVILFSGQIATASPYGYLTNPKDTEGFGFDTLKEILDRKKPRDIDETLSLLPQGLRSQAIIMYKSRSLQGASPSKPRIILFNNDASFALTFNGDNSHKGYDAIETYQFDRAKKIFEFREISFKDETPSISKINPAKCLECHQSTTRATVDPRPNWEPYSTWKGAIGSVGGRVSPESIHHEEVPILTGFLSRYRSLPRYRRLDLGFYEKTWSGEINENEINMILGYSLAVPSGKTVQPSVVKG